MFNPDDTIVAIATPAGRGGIGVVRVSGPRASEIASSLSEIRGPLEPRHATLSRIVANGVAVDRAVLTFFPSPHSYTGEDVLEISAHGSPVLLEAIVRASVQAGARLAEPGEFTFRAYLRGRIDLVQAEAVRDLVDAVTPLQARAAFDQLEGTLTTRIAAIDAALFDVSARLEASLDFADEGYHFIEPSAAASEIEAVGRSIDALLADAARGRLVRDGAQVVILGRPNTGKSSLFNRLAGAARAIVTDVAGTTRDLVTEVVDLDGIAVTLVDTAGLRAMAADPVELEGIARADAARQVADLVVVVLDGSAPLEHDDRDLVLSTAGARRVIVQNKSDLRRAWLPSQIAVPLVPVSARTGEGFGELRAAIVAELSGSERLRDTPALTNMRHVEVLTRARAALGRAAVAAAAGTPEEFVAADLGEARAYLEEVTGARTPEDVLGAIFSRFCIGK
ncbi:MAG: tRNA modification GTPase [Acidobacteriota bacterium]|jgi:tRNA modification GTPase